MDLFAKSQISDWQGRLMMKPENTRENRRFEAFTLYLAKALSIQSSFYIIAGLQPYILLVLGQAASEMDGIRVPSSWHINDKE